MSARHPLSTNSELAKLLEDHVAKIRESIPGERVLISDQTTLALILRAAEVLVEQDARIGELTVGLRELGGRAARKYFLHRTAREGAPR